MKPILSLNFYLLIVHAFCGLWTVDTADPLPVASTNPNLAVQQVILKFFGVNDPDAAATCGQLIESRGFQFERYYVTTEDGYILQNFRIINPYAKEARKSLKPVLLLHPLLTSCSAWLWQPGGHIKPWKDGKPPDDDSSSIGFLLANLGYDVWLMNIRGTSYSTNHTHFDPYTDTEFWNFSFYEIGVYDVTATVEHIKKTTGFESIIAIGHSQGTAELLIQLSEIPEYEKNYDLVILAAPLGFLGDKHGIASLSIIDSLEPFFSLNNSTFPPFPPIFYSWLTVTCRQPLWQQLCIEILENSVGYDPEQLDSSRFAVYTSLLDQSSNKNFLHYIQFTQTDHLSYYNYGEERNKVLYGSAESPEFPFYKINASKLVLISALNDNFATPINVQNLRNSLNQTRGDYVIDYPYFNHIDFITAIDAYPYFGKLVSQLIADQI